MACHCTSGGVVQSIPKVEFENYFLNQIKTESQNTEPDGEGFVHAALDTMQKERMQDPAPQRVLSATMKTLQIPIQQHVYNELRALASVMNREPIDIAGQLLEAVIHDAKSHISEALLAEVEQTRRNFVISDLADNQPRAEFGGDTK